MYDKNFIKSIISKSQNIPKEPPLNEGIIDKIQSGLDVVTGVASFIPGLNLVASGIDAVSAAVDLAQGQGEEAAWRGGSAVAGLIPGGGAVAKGAKLAKAAGTAMDVAKAGGAVSDVARAGGAVSDVARATNTTTDLARTANTADKVFDTANAARREQGLLPISNRNVPTSTATSTTMPTNSLGGIGSGIRRGINAASQGLNRLSNSRVGRGIGRAIDALNSAPTAPGTAAPNEEAMRKAANDENLRRGVNVSSNRLGEFDPGQAGQYTRSISTRPNSAMRSLPEHIAESMKKTFKKKLKTKIGKSVKPINSRIEGLKRDAELNIQKLSEIDLVEPSKDVKSSPTGRVASPGGFGTDDPSGRVFDYIPIGMQMNFYRPGNLSINDSYDPTIERKVRKAVGSYLRSKEGKQLDNHLKDIRKRLAFTGE